MIVVSITFAKQTQLLAQDSEEYTMDNPLMSTHRKLPVDWEILPLEIWTLIFRHATLVPDLTSIELCNYGMGDPMMSQQRKLHKQSLVSFMSSSSTHYYIVSRGRSKG